MLAANQGADNTLADSRAHNISPDISPDCCAIEETKIIPNCCAIREAHTAPDTDPDTSGPTQRNDSHNDADGDRNNDGGTGAVADQ